MSDIKEKIEMELKPFESICEDATEHLKELISGSEEADPQEILTVAKTLGEIIDMKKDIVEMCYKKQILEAMEEADYGVDYDEDGRLYYRGRSRDSMGRYTSRGGRRGYDGMDMGDMYPSAREMDGPNGRMYYSEGMSSSRRSSGSGRNNGSTRYGFAYDQYMESKKHQKGMPDENNKRIELLNDFIEDLEDMAKDAVKDMSPEERQIWKIKLNKLTSL